MIEDDSFENINEKNNRYQYKNRFGIDYRSFSSNDLMSFGTFKKTSPKHKNTSSIKSTIHPKIAVDIKLNSIITTDVGQYDLDRLYKNIIIEEDSIIPLHNFNKISKCSIIKYGIKASTDEIKYSYCKTCDHNLVRPICYPCITQCHKGHMIKPMLEKGKIKCFCGERNHFQNQITNNVVDYKSINCFCNEWNITAKLGFYYVNKKKETICILCHNYCISDNKKDKIIKIEYNKKIPNCTCKNLDIHKTHKVLCEKIISLITDYNEFHILLHPIQFINMLFKSSNNFKLIFEDFETFTDNLKNLEKTQNFEFFKKFRSIDITNTNSYKTLQIFEKLIQKKAKNSYIYFYNEEILNYFSFDIIKNLYIIVEKSSAEEKSFRILMIKYLYLFHKIYINIKTQTLSKFKLTDLKNLSFLQRIIIFNKNKFTFIESKEIISFLLKILNHMIYKDSSTIESIECMKEIISIFRKLSCYNLITNEQMVTICICIIKYFNHIRIIKNLFINKSAKKNNYDLKGLDKILLKLYYVIMKMIFNFIYNYNDNILNKIIFNKEKYLSINNINFNNVSFIFNKNELGKLIFKINISILSIIQKNYKDIENKKVISIQRIGFEILQYSLNGKDNYILNIIDSLSQVKFYYNNSQRLKTYNSKYYKEMAKHCSSLLKSFYDYFNFEKTIEELLLVTNHTLNYVFGETHNKGLYLNENENPEVFNNNQIITFISTDFINILCKVIGIIYHYQNRKNVFDNNKKSNNIKLNLFIKSLALNLEDEIIKRILYFYNCFALNSSDNSLLILSHSIFIELTKVPIKHCQLAFKLIYLCINNILASDNNDDINKIIIDQKNILKRIYEYLEKLFEDNNVKSSALLNCLYNFLKIIEISLFNSHSSLSNNLIYKVQHILTSIDKKYNIINKYFEMKDNELIALAKNNNITLDYNNDTKDYSISNMNLVFYERNILQKSFAIYIKLINNCFDFSIDTDRKKIEEMLNINKVTFALQNYKLNLELRTEFLRLLRKILLDIKYSNNDNELYVKSIINSQDKLMDIKTNPLITNIEYPTKLLLFLNDFYNVTAKCMIKERIKELSKKEKQKANNILDITRSNRPSINSNIKTSENNPIKNSKTENFNYNYNFNGILNKSIRSNLEKNSEDEQEQQKDTINELNISLMPKINKYDHCLSNEIILEENISKQNIESDEETAQNNNNNTKKDDSKKFLNINSIYTRNSINLSISKNKKRLSQNEDNIHRRGSFFTPLNSKCKLTLESKQNLPSVLLPLYRKSIQSIKSIKSIKSITSNEDEFFIDAKTLEFLMKTIKQNNDEQFHNKCKENNLLEEAFNPKFYYIINYELDNVKRNIENIKLNGPEKIEYLRNYFENGLLIPIIFYFKKVFTFVHLLSGEEMKKLFFLVEKTIKLKSFISEFKIDFWHNNANDIQSNKVNGKNIYIKKSEINNFHNQYYTKYKNPSIIDGTCFNDKSIDLAYKSLSYIKSNRISIFDYTYLYQIIDKELFSLIKNRNVLNVLNNFKEKKCKSLNQKINKEEKKMLNGKNIPLIQKRLLKGLIIYKYSKIACFNDNNSSILNILPEITLGYETNYRNLLITLLINYGKDINIRNEHVDISYFLLFKLLSLQTTEIQNDIIHLLGGENKENTGFLREFTNILFYRIILTFIDYLNTPDKLTKSNYFVCCNLIYIFKLLCKEHNNYFQRHFIRNLSFPYIENNPSFFTFRKDEENHDLDNDKNANPNIVVINEKNKKLNVNFYDFFLYLLTKITLISNWENNYKNDSQHQNPFLYDLFSSIIDLLTEIIQGCEPDLLSSLCINIEEGAIDIFEYDIEKFKKIDSFGLFIKTIKKLLFQEKYNIEFINEMRSNLMHFITSILEEKNCNEIMKKYIKRYININNVYRIISTILKSYYLKKEKNQKIKTNKESFEDLIKKKKEENENKFTKDFKRKHSFLPVYRPKIKNFHKKGVSRFSCDVDNTSAIKLINPMRSSYIYNDFNKKSIFSFLTLEKEKTLEKKEEKTFQNKRFSKNNNDGKIIDEKIVDEKIVDEKRKSKISELEISNLIFGKKLYNYFKDQFYENIEFSEQFEFKLSNSFYRYIKNIKSKNDIKHKIIYEEIKKLIDIDGDLFLDSQNSEDKLKNLYNIVNYDRDLLEKFYIEKFFEDITSNVEICTNDGINKFIIYTKLPVMKFLSKETKIDFKENVNRDNETSKKYDLIRYIHYFLKEIKYFKTYRNKWDFWFLKFDFYYLDLLSYSIALIYNLFLLFTLKGDNQITYSNDSNSLEQRYRNQNIIQILIGNSINNWNIIYKIINYFYLLLNGILILLWIVYKLPLYYRIDSIKYREKFKIYKKKKLGFSDKLYIIFKMNFFGRNYIFLLIYEFVIMIICLSIKNSELIISFLLLPVFYLNKTLKNIISSIKLNYKQFFLTFLLTFIIIYIFSNFYFFFYNSDFKTELTYKDDNYCKTLIFSFLTALDAGLRARGGIGDSAKRISYGRNKMHYLFRLIIDDFFFLLIIIIMIDLVFGIIIKSFDVLRHRNQKYYSDKKNYCLICHSSKDSLEKMRINFYDHVKKVHYVWNYVEYMISLKIKDMHDLNVINQYVRAKMDKNDISWLPKHKDEFNNNRNNNDLEDSKIIVYLENIENYKIKTDNFSI